MPAPIDLTGKRFGRLVVLRLAPKEGGRERRWICRCDCGSETSPTSKNLKSGNTASCGCLRRETVYANARPRAIRHGMTGTPTHKSWMSMIHRVSVRPND